MLKLNHQIIDAVTPYAQTAMYEMVHSVTDIVYIAAHPLETCKGLGKALYYLLETASFNDPELGSYEQLRDQRSEEIIAGLNFLGDKIANSTGPERFGALVGLAADIVIPEKILAAVGEVCGFVKTQAKVMRTLEGVASIAEEQGLTQELIQATEKLTVAAKENVAKNLSAELIEADKNIAKSANAVSGLQVKEEVETVVQNAIKDLLKDTVPGDVTSGRARQYIKNGCYEDAIKDFYSLNPSNVKKMSGKEGLHGILPDGRSINVRLESTYNRSISSTEIMKSGNTLPTIEIMKEGGTGTRIKIRYKNKL